MITITEVHEDKQYADAATVITMAFIDTKEKNGVEFALSSIDGESLRKLIEDGHGVCLIAMDEDKVVGTLSIVRQKINRWYYKGETLKIRLVGVLPQYYGKHIGSQLVSEAISYFKNSGYCNIIVQTPANNYPAQKLYKKFGFEKVRYYNNKDHDVIDYAYWEIDNKPNRYTLYKNYYRSKISTFLHRKS